MPDVFISIGSNQGCRITFLQNAVYYLLKIPDFLITNISSVYETDPVGYTNQPKFLNAVVKAKTSILPEKLLEILKYHEMEVGRKQSIKWGPRDIDLDILFYGKEIIETKNLSIPHKELLNRDFVLIPLIEISPNIVIPQLNYTLKDYINNNLKKTIHEYKESNLSVLRYGKELKIVL